MKSCVIYLRTSSATNVGENKDSDKRQILACEKYALSNKLNIENVFYDADVNGSIDHLEREGFSDLLDFCFKESINIVLCENHTRFSRDLIVQEKGYIDMKKAGITIIPINNPDMFLDDRNEPTRTLIRHMLGALSQYEKTSIVLKLKGARERKRIINKKQDILTIKGNGKVEGRKRYGENKQEQIVVDRINELRFNSLKNGKLMSIRKITDIINDEGFTTKKNTKFHFTQIQRILNYS